MDDNHARIHDAIAATESDMLAWLVGLVRTPSTFGHEGEAQRYVEDGYAATGLDTDMFEPTLQGLLKNPFATPVPWDYVGRPNVVGVMRGAGGGRSITLNGHIDVVDPGPREDWTVDPWAGSIMNGWLYGRGATDMKAGLAQMLWAVRALKRAGIRLRGDVVLQSVLEEETTGNGTLACCMRGYRTDAAILGEPTGLRIRLAQSTIAGFAIDVRGRIGTHLERHQRVNAHDVAIWLAGRVLEYQAVRNADVTHPSDASLRTPTLCTVSRLTGADWPDHVALRCTVEGRLAGLPTEDVQSVRDGFIAYLADVAKEHPWLAEAPPDLRWIAKQVPGSIMDPDDPFLQRLAAAHRLHHGEGPGHQIAVGYCDMWQFQRVQGIPVTAYGPMGENSHAPDERVRLDSVRTGATVIANTLVDWCGVEDDSG